MWRTAGEFLRGHRRVEWVNYAGFPENPYHALAQKYLGGRACSVLTFGVKGGFEAGKKFYDALKLIKRLVVPLQLLVKRRCTGLSRERE